MSTAREIFKIVLKTLRFIVLLVIPFSANAQSIVNTVHNLSATGPGDTRATLELGVCVFCHATHIEVAGVPLWNKNTQGTIYTLYKSSTLQALPGQPDGASILCLSCHDGTVALGNLQDRALSIDFSRSVNTIQGSANLGTDLRNDHPISFEYTSRLAGANKELKDPASITPPVVLEGNKVQCTSCHDPHKSMEKNFLVKTAQYSNLCNSCHQKEYWRSSVHQNSSATWNGSGPDPWFHASYSSVAENACENCHNTHNAGGFERLLKYRSEESNCLDCHNGNVAKGNIAAQLAKRFTHDVYAYVEVHDPIEPVLPVDRHVECIDCHNPHAANSNLAVAPDVNGTLKGVRGISFSGNEINPALYEYQVCFRCHSNNAVTVSPTARIYGQNNLRKDFDPANVSFHPVVRPRNNSELTSLIAPLNQSSMIYCTDCHASDGGASPAGPHGSIYPQILKYNYNREVATNLPKSSGAVTYSSEFELCAKCHNMNIVVDRHSSMKDSHVLNLTSCNTCHDPHGFQGGNSVNNAYLINFDTRVISPNSNGLMNIRMNGDGTGNCNLKCHDNEGSYYMDHINTEY